MSNLLFFSMGMLVGAVFPFAYVMVRLLALKVVFPCRHCTNKSLTPWGRGWHELKHDLERTVL